MTTGLLIELDVGIGPFKFGQSFREVVNLSREFRAIEQPSSIEYSDIQPFHQHLLIRSNISISDCSYQLLFAFEPHTQNLILIKLSLAEKQLITALRYSRENGAVKICSEQEEGYMSLANIAQFLSFFKKKKIKFEEKIEKQIKILQTLEELGNQKTMFLFRTDIGERDGEEFHSISSSQTSIVNNSVKSDISRVDTSDYKLKSIVILSKTYTAQIQSVPTRNLTPLSPLFTYNSTHDYIHIAINNRTYSLNCTDSAQEILTKIGTPNTKYYTKPLQKTPSYFYNYKTLGLDLMFNCNTHKVSMIVLHNNLPGHAHFNEYSRAFFTITHQLIEDEIFDISYHTHWHSLSSETSELSELPSVTVSRNGNANSQYPFLPTTLVYLTKCCLLEVHDNGYISNVFIATNFSQAKLIDKYTHRRLNLLKQTETPPPTSSIPLEDTLTVNPFIDETPQLFNSEFSAKSNTVKHAYKKLPDLEDDYALYSYNPYIEPQPIPFKPQQAEQTNRTNYILKRIEVSGKTAHVKNRVKFDDIAYIPLCMQDPKRNKTAVRDELPRAGSGVSNDAVTNGDIPNGNGETNAIFDSDMNSVCEDTESQVTFQSNGFASRYSPTNSEVTEATPLSTVTTDSIMYSLKSNLFQSTHEQISNEDYATLDPQLSIQSNISRKSTKFDLSSQPPDFQALIENATQEEIDFPKLTKEHNRISPLLTQRLDIYSKVLPFWYSGKNQQAIEVISGQQRPLSQSDPPLYAHLIKLFLTKEYNWTIKSSHYLLESLLDWISMECPDYQLETTCLVIRLVIKRFRVRLIGNEPTNKTLKEQFSTFINTLFLVFTRLEAIISHHKARPINESILRMVTECHHDLRLFRSKFPAS